MVVAQHLSGGVVLEASGLTKRYGPIEALVDVDLTARSGSLTAVVGDNGAGKSTLMKILAGATARDAGEVRLHSLPVNFMTPLAARAGGIETIYQDLALCGNLDAVANIFLGRELRKYLFGIPVPVFRILDKARMRKSSSDEIKRLSVNIPGLFGRSVGEMSGGQRQAVAIARAAYWASDVLLMDEPTAALGVAESRAVLRLVGKVLEGGMAVLMVSHIMPHVIEIADHVVVLRHGRKVADLPAEGLTTQDLIQLIVGDR